MKTVTVSLLYVYYNTPSEIISSLHSLKQSLRGKSYEVIIIDNASPKPLPADIKKYKHITFIKNKANVGYGKALNQAAKKAKGTYLLLLNPDTVFEKGAVSHMIDRIKTDKSIGMLGPRLVDEKKKILQSISGAPVLPDALFAFSFVDTLWKNNPLSQRFWLRDTDRKKEQFVTVIGGACMLIPAKLFKEIGGFDERFFMYFEESDICMRVLKRGYKVLYYPKAVVMHHIGRSSQDKKKDTAYL